MIGKIRGWYRDASATNEHPREQVDASQGVYLGIVRVTVYRKASCHLTSVVSRPSGECCLRASARPLEEHPRGSLPGGYYTPLSPAYTSRPTIFRV